MPPSEQPKDKDTSSSHVAVEEEEQDAPTKAMPGYLGGAYNGVCNAFNGALDKYLGTGEPAPSSSTVFVESPINETEEQKKEEVVQESITEDKPQENDKDVEPSQSEPVKEEATKKEEEKPEVEEAKVQSTAEKAVDDVKQIAQQTYQSAGKTFDGVRQKAFEAYEKLTSSSKKQVNDGVQKIKEAAEASQKAIKRASMRPEKKKEN